MRRGFRWVVLGCGVVGLAALTLPDELRLRRGTDGAYSQAYQRLLDCFAETRPIEARVTGESAYRPYKRSPSPDSQERPRTITRSEAPRPLLRVPADLASIIETVVRRDPSPENRAALAVLRLLQGDTSAAVSVLRAAYLKKPDDPRLLNDLAAALLEVSRETETPWAALEAIEVTQRSLRLGPSLPALFNQSLAFERWGLRTRAIQGWRRYLEQDGRSLWADEAARRLDRLERGAVEGRVTRNPWAARRQGEWTLLTRWSEETRAGRRAAALAALEEAETLSEILSAGGGRLLAASLAVIRDADQAGDQARFARLARGHQAFGRALMLAREEQRAASLPFLESAIEDLRAAASPFELRARVQRVLVADKPDWAELRDLVRTAEDKGFLSVAADARFIAAYRISLEGRLEAAVDAYRDAQQRFEELDEKEMSAVTAVMLAELLETLDRQEEAGIELAKALAAGPWVADAWNRYSIYVVAASTARSHRFSRAAVELRLEAADVCRALLERPLCAVDSWLWVAGLTPDQDVAEAAFREATDLLRTVPDSESKERTALDLSAVRARWLARDDGSTADWEEAAELYPSVAASYESRGRAVSAARARADRAGVLHHLGRDGEAAAEYRSALESFRRWDRSERFQPASADSSPRELRVVYERLIDNELDAAQGGPSPAAFLLSEEMRDRLAPRRSKESWQPGGADADRLAARVPAGTAIVEYALFGDRAVAWILARDGLAQVILTPGGDLGQRIRSLARERSARSWKSTSGILFQEFLAPVLGRLPAGVERLVLVPDSELYSLPFRALWDPTSGRYLDEILILELAPSVRRYLGDGDEPRAAPSGSGLPILSLGFGRFDSALGLDPLRWAETESATVLERYGAPLGRCRATDWASFRRCAPEAEVLHLATHAAADSTQTNWTWLAFPQDTVLLIRLWRELPSLPRRPLVVLSACESVAGGGEGLGGLARPFLASGARAVVGTLWKIRDRDAAALFPDFHQAYRESGDAAEALRTMREAMAGWAEKPWVWGGIEVIAEGDP